MTIETVIQEDKETKQEIARRLRSLLLYSGDPAVGFLSEVALYQLTGITPPSIARDRRTAEAQMLINQTQREVLNDWSKHAGKRLEEAEMNGFDVHFTLKTIAGYQSHIEYSKSFNRFVLVPDDKRADPKYDRTAIDRDLVGEVRLELEKSRRVAEQDQYVFQTELKFPAKGEWLLNTVAKRRKSQ